LFVVFDPVVFGGVVGFSPQDFGGAESATDGFDGEIPGGGFVGGGGHEEEAVDAIAGGGSLFSVSGCHDGFVR
jgi:hypothetical protein